jgi:hypothetical protein
VLSPLLPGTYRLKVIDVNGCEYEEDLTIPDVSDIQIELENSYTISLGDSLRLSPVFRPQLPENSTILWYLKDSLLCANCFALTVQPSQNTIYRIVFSPGGFCEEEFEILVQVNRQMFTAIPNIFNPSSKDGNHIFYIPQTRGIQNINYLYIFDRWAENVFKAENVLPGDASWGWDGTFKGRECQPGVYVVISEWTLSDGTKVKYQGDVTLIR